MTKGTVLIADDEPHYLEWLGEFVEKQGYEAVFVESVNAAFELLVKRTFRAVIVDLNIPVTGVLTEVVASRGSLFSQFPGLYIAFVARNKKHRPRQVIVYTVHILEAIDAECRKLSCTYITKGKPGLFKQELLEVFAYDPTKSEKRSPAAKTDKERGSKVARPTASKRRK